MANATKPNLLVFLPDQLRADMVVGEYAGDVHAPNIRKLVSESVVFERTYITQPICAPSRSSLLSGTWPHQNGCINNQSALSPKVRCLPEMLGDPDYATGYLGKWHLGDEFSPQRGFKEWVSVEEYFKSALGDRPVSGVSDYTKFLLSKGYKPDLGDGQYFGRRFVHALPFEESSTKFLEGKACDFLERHQNQPFVLFVAFVEPHAPYEGPFNNEHPLDGVSLDESATDTFGDEMPLRYRLRQEFFRLRIGLLAEYRELRRKYYGLITQVDLCIGGILDKVDQLGIDQRTIIVLTSDHGDLIGAHGMVGKRLMFDPSARVPYLVRIPGQSPFRCSSPISHIDFVPTMLEFLDKPVDRQCAGKSRVSALRRETDETGPVFLEWSPGREKINKRTKLGSKRAIQRCLSESTRAVVSSDGWKLCLRDKDKNELYNLSNDPGERHNLYYDGGRRDTIDRLTNEVRRWQEQTGDTIKLRL
jgi:arylsulfatase A-like enzyme